MKLELRAVEYENIIFDLNGVAYLLNILAANMLEQENTTAFYALQLLQKIVQQDAQKLEDFMKKQNTPS